MTYDDLYAEYKKRRIPWISDDEFKIAFEEVCEKYKNVNVDEILKYKTYSNIVDCILGQHLDTINTDSDRFKDTISIIKKIKDNPILMRLNRWFCLINLGEIFKSKFSNIFSDYSFLIINFYKNIWRDEFKSNNNLNYQEKYKFDSNGYRVYEQAPNQDYIACFGCENTFGLDLNDEETWAYILSKMLQLNVENYGEIDGSSDVIARNIWQYLQYKKPKAIFVLFPDIKRFEYIVDDDPYKGLNLTPEKQNIKYKIHKSYLNLATKSNCLTKFLENFLLIKILCHNRNIPFYWYTCSNDLIDTPFDEYSISNKDINLYQTHTDGNKLINIFDNSSMLLSHDDNIKIADIFYNLYTK